MKQTFLVLITSLVLAPVYGDQTANHSEKMGYPLDPECCFDPGYELPCGCTCAGYNYPAQININSNEWDAFINVSFLYWEASEDGLHLGINQSGTRPTDDSVLYQSFSYEPGVAVEAGFRSDCWDDWGGLIGYTRMHGSYENHHSRPTDTGRIDLYPWISQNNSFANSFASKWKNELDVIDFGLYRTYYVGRRLTLMTYFGGRGGWINQALNFEVDVQNINAGLAIPSRLENESESWFVGPRAALRTNWLLGWGFSLVGNTSGSICYQKYTITQDQDETTTLGQTGIRANLDVGQLRPYFDMQAGLKWGMYTCGRRFHFDLQATYDFMVYFQQNGMRMLADLIASGSEGAMGNLYFQGLTLKGQFTF